MLRKRLCFFTTSASAFQLKAFTVCIVVVICNFEKSKKQLWKGLSGFDRRKVAKRKFLCSNVQSLKVVSKKISGLLMFSEIGKLPARKKIALLEPGSVCVQRFPNTRVWASNHACLDLFFNRYQGAST